MDSSAWEEAALLLAVLAPLVGAPLTVLVFHLKGLREQQRVRLAELAGRVAMLENAGLRMRQEVMEARRDHATKEEWLRESMWARGRIEALAAAVARWRGRRVGMRRKGGR